MGRISEFNGSQKTIANTTAQSIVFTSSEIPSQGVVALHGTFSGANDMDDISRIRVRAGGESIMDCTPLELRALQQAFGWALTPNANTANRFTIPLNLLEGLTEDERDRCQFPVGREIQVEIETLATIVSGVMIMGWTITDRSADSWSTYLSSQLNIAASIRNGKFAFSTAGVLRGWTMPTAGVDRAELYVSGRKAWSMPGPQFAGLTIGSLLEEKDFLETAQGVTATTCKKVSTGIPGAQGSTQLILDTGAGWAGAANNGVPYVLNAIAKAQ